ncbi:MAG: hypothetical protein ACRYF4_00190 [Janthinobacterium lividum]
MKRILFAAAFILTSTLTFAQAPVPQQDTPAPHAKHVANPHKAAMKISNELGLSADQESKLEPVIADRQRKIAAVRANTALTEADRKQQIRTIHQASNAQMKAVLSDDQMKQLSTMHRERKAVMKPTGL